MYVPHCQAAILAWNWDKKENDDMHNVATNHREQGAIGALGGMFMGRSASFFFHLLL